MRRTKWGLLALTGVIVVGLCGFDDTCDNQPAHASEPNGEIHKVDASVKVGADGMTSEQRNIKARLEEDNKPGAIKHLYVISPYSGQVILYSTVKGKVTSGTKRLTPTSVAVARTGRGVYDLHGLPFNGGETTEVMQDDGTYGSSGDYLYWWDVRGSYHQHYLTGGQIVTISDQPLPVKSVTINIEAVKE